MEFSAKFYRFMSENYSSLGETQRLWRDSKGRVSQILDQQTSQVRWNDLLKKAEAGAIQAEFLILNALKDYPFNPELIHELARWVPEKNLNSAYNYLNDNNLSQTSEFHRLSDVEAASALTTSIVQQAAKEEPNIISSPQALSKKFAETFAIKGIDLLTAASLSGWSLLLHQVMA